MSAAGNASPSLDSSLRSCCNRAIFKTSTTRLASRSRLRSQTAQSTSSNPSPLSMSCSRCRQSPFAATMTGCSLGISAPSPQSPDGRGVSSTGANASGSGAVSLAARRCLSRSRRSLSSLTAGVSQARDRRTACRFRSRRSSLELAAMLLCRGSKSSSGDVERRSGGSGTVSLQAREASKVRTHLQRTSSRCKQGGKGQ
jgi:hypothetical protein